MKRGLATQGFLHFMGLRPPQITIGKNRKKKIEIWEFVIA
jgi:hypothetical protein